MSYGPYGGVEKYVISAIRFGLLSPREIREMAKVTVIRPELYESDGSPVMGGLRDPHFGAIEPGETCPVCGNRREACPGHFGKIDLARPVVLPHLGEKIYRTLQATCRNCGRVLIPPQRAAYMLSVYRRLKERWPILAEIFAEELRRPRRPRSAPTVAPSSTGSGTSSLTTSMRRGQRAR